MTTVKHDTQPEPTADDLPRRDFLKLAWGTAGALTVLGSGAMALIESLLKTGWLHYLILPFLALFLLGPLTGIWIVTGNLSASMTLDVLPLTDPLVLLQSLLAGHAAELTAITGALTVCYSTVMNSRLSSTSVPSSRCS